MAFLTFIFLGSLAVLLFNGHAAAALSLGSVWGLLLGIIAVKNMPR